MSEYSIIFCTVPQGDKGKEIAELLVSKKFAACVNIIPGIQSVYTWKGDLCKDAESLLIIKTKSTLFASLMNEIRSIHPYEVPEIIQFDIQDGYPGYLQWIGESTL